MKEKTFNDFNKALDKLKTAISLDIKEDIVRDAIIKRFEFTYELAWKTLKRFIEFKGDTCISPRDCFKKGFKYSFILYNEDWLEMIEARNLTSHTYSEEKALAIIKSIHNKFLPLFIELEKNLKKTLTEETN
ncbi:nucleotidyltransferase substrate binding protein [Thermoproteota archaeon]